MIKKSILSLIIVALAAFSANARDINISGKITIKGSAETLNAVAILNGTTQKVIGMSDDDGNYLITADSQGTLIFEHPACEDLTVEIDDRMKINVEMTRTKNVLEEIVVERKGNKKTFVMEDAELELDGNIMRIKRYKVHIPPKLFSDERRLTIQPAVFNVTRQQLTYLTPVVVDGWKYAYTQERMDDWNLSIDTLTHYRRIKYDANDKEHNVIEVTDSLYLEDPTNDVFALIMPMIEDYNKVIYTDSFEIAKGMINPFRWLKFNLDAMDMNDSRYIPLDLPEPRDNVGEMNLIFNVGKTNLDPTLGENEKELEALLNEFRKIENDPNSTLKGFSIYGFASPEGSYEKNVQLANARMKSAMDWINRYKKFNKKVEVSHEATVTPWEEVVKLLRADSLFEEADKVQAILNDYTTPDSRSLAIARLPFYRPLLTDTYLPKLRRVSYNIKTEFYRPLTDAEIDENYKIDPTGLAKSHFYRYYTAREGAEREEVLRKALEVYPNDFVVAATDLAKLILDKHENASKEEPFKLLEPYFTDYKTWNTRPVSARYNFGVAAMNNMRYSLADSLFFSVPESPETHKAKMYCQVMVGNFQDVIDEVTEDSPLNEVLILLKMKNNSLAWRKAQGLGDTAVEEYVKAIAAHRVDDWQDLDLLKSALRKDKSLIETAKIDGDVVDMYENLTDDDWEDINTPIEEDEPEEDSSESDGESNSEETSTETTSTENPTE